MTTQAPRVGGRECPVREGTPDQCKATVRPGHLMCGRHWAQVPTAIREAVWRRWRAWQRTSTDTAWDHYMEARQEALDHFTQQDATHAATPSEGLTLEELDEAALVLVVATDGHTRMWHGGDNVAAGKVLQRVWADLATRTEPAHDEHP